MRITPEKIEGEMDRPTEAGTKLTAIQFRLLQRIPDEGLTQITLRQGRGNNTAAQTRTLHILIQLDLVVERASENGEVRYELTDAGRPARFAGRAAALDYSSGSVVALPHAWLFAFAEEGIMTGSITLDAVAERTDTLAVACSRCDRTGQYRLDTLIINHGRVLASRRY